MTCIDTHVHFWKYNKERDSWLDDMKILQQDYIPQTIEPVLKRNDVTGCVAVQVEQSEVETRFLCELAKTHPIIKGVVGWVDLCADNVEERLEHFTAYKEVKGYRHIVQGEPHDFMLRKDFQRGVKTLKTFDLTYDILIYHYQLRPALEFVSRLPDQKMVIDHCAKPDIKRKEIDKWAGLMKEIARNPNIYCKLSGLFTETNWKAWSAGDFYPYLDVVFEAFGTDRLMYGSDWPVILVSGIYVQWKSLLEKYMENYEDEDREKVFGQNAIRFYNL